MRHLLPPFYCHRISRKTMTGALAVPCIHLLSGRHAIRDCLIHFGIEIANRFFEGDLPI